MNSDSLKYVLREFADRPLPESHPRELSLPTDSGKVIGLSGVYQETETDEIEACCEIPTPLGGPLRAAHHPVLAN